jgi:hypothetical protein
MKQMMRGPKWEYLLIRTALLIALLTPSGCRHRPRACRRSQRTCRRAAPAGRHGRGQEASSQDVLGDPNFANAKIRYRHLLRSDPREGHEHHEVGKGE